jgi:hypothetical protein
MNSQINKIIKKLMNNNKKIRNKIIKIIKIKCKINLNRILIIR